MPTDLTPPAARDAVTIDVHLDPQWMSRSLRADVRAGLSRTPKELPPKWFYDEAGSELFDQITRLPEYYPTEAEREILREHAAEIAQISQAEGFIELGSGTSDKTRVLLDAFTSIGTLRTYLPFDVSEATLRAAAADLAIAYPDLAVHGVVGDFDHHLECIPGGGRQLTAFLGSTIGNYKPAGRARFVSRIADRMRPGDTLLLGADLVKDKTRLELAYDDPAGVTAAFNKNVLAVLNRELGADFNVSAFEHVAFFDERNEWVDLQLRSLADQRVRIAALDMEVQFAVGEQMRTEISAKFRPRGIEAELGAAALELVDLWTDARGDFSLSLARKR